MSDTNISPASGALLLGGKRNPPQLLYQLNGTDATTTGRFGPYSLVGTDVGTGAVIGPFQLIGGAVERTALVGSLSFTGAASAVIYSAAPNLVPEVGAVALSGVAPTLAIEATPQTVPVGELVIEGVAPAVSMYSGSNCVFEAMEGYGQAVFGPSGAAEFKPMVGDGTELELIRGSGGGTFEAMVIDAHGRPTGAGLFEAMTSAGLTQQVASGGGLFEALVTTVFGGAGLFEPLYGGGTARMSFADAFSTYVMNTHSNAVSSYQNYPFNSYTRTNQKEYLAAGPSGLALLEGDDDNGDDINWVLRTSQLNDSNRMLKRLPEVVMGLRASGPIRVRVYGDDETYYDYMLPATKQRTIHQQRVKCGKGLRSEYFSVELQGVSNSAMRIDSLQLPFAKTSRRIG